MDFAGIKNVVQPIITKIDHQMLNQVTELAHPTSEMLAKWIYEYLRSTLPYLAAIIVEESEGSECEYRP